MGTAKGTKNKLIKGLTEHDVLTFEEEKMKYQRRQGRKVTDLEFLRFLLMYASRPSIPGKEGVSRRLIRQIPNYDKNETLLEKVRESGGVQR